MLSRIYIALLSTTLLLTACTPSTKSSATEDIIGVPLSKMSKTYGSTNTSSDQVALFDKVTKKIHVFELSSMNHINSYSPPHPEKNHTVLHHPSGNYSIDLTSKSLTIFSRSGAIQNDLVSFEGTPISGAFNPEKNLLVIYDDTNSVIVMKLNASGQEIQSYIGGPQLGPSDSIKAGDMLADGNLVLILSNSKIVTIDIEQTLTQQQWVKKSEFTPALTETVSWIAPLQDNAAQVVYYSQSKFGILDINTGNIVTEISLPYKYVQVLSKGSDPHVITKEDSTGRILMLYAKDSQIEKKELPKQKSNIIDSYLKLTENIWNYIDSGSVHYNYSADGKSSTAINTARKIKVVRISDMLTKTSLDIPDACETTLSKDYLFSLYPSDMGYATSTHLESKTLKEAKYFNNGVAE